MWNCWYAWERIPGSLTASWSRAVNAFGVGRDIVTSLVGGQRLAMLSAAVSQVGFGWRSGALVLFPQANVPLLFGYRFFVPPFRVARFGRYSRRLSHARIATRTI